VTETPEQAARRLQHASSFGAAAADYARYRPRYADAAILWCLEPAGHDRPRVADLGAGTGILTGALRRLGADVTAVEPDPQMLAELRRQLPDVSAQPGSAEAIPLPDDSVDVVIAGQALHWFDLDKALPEIARVLVPGGVLAGLWNIYDDQADPWLTQLVELIGPELGPQTLTSWQRAAREIPLQAKAAELFSPVEADLFENPRQMRADDLVAMLATHSGFLVLSDDERSEVLGKVSDFLRQHPDTSAGEFTVPMLTNAVRTQAKS
jgi:SAM-dependent methyltransferase